MSSMFKNINWGVVSAILAMIGVALFEYVTPQPVSSLTTQKKTDKAYEQEVDAKSEELVVAEAEFQKVLWQKSRDEIGPAAMAWVSQAARSKLIDVRSWRPQRMVREDGVDQLNYLVTAEGSYPAVMAFLKEFESEESLLAVKLVQLGSIDGATDLVRASIGLVAYLEVEDNG